MLVQELNAQLASQAQTLVDAYWERRGGTQGFADPDVFVADWQDAAANAWLTNNGFLKTQPGYWEHVTDKNVVANTRDGNQGEQKDLVVFLDVTNLTDAGFPQHQVVPV